MGPGGHTARGEDRVGGDGREASGGSKMPVVGKRGGASQAGRSLVVGG